EYARQTRTQRKLGVDGLSAVSVGVASRGVGILIGELSGVGRVLDHVRSLSISHGLCRLLVDDLGGGTGFQFLRKRRCAFVQGLAAGAGRRPGGTTSDPATTRAPRPRTRDPRRQR